jgi:hypothetical protein
MWFGNEKKCAPKVKIGDEALDESTKVEQHTNERVKCL